MQQFYFFNDKNLSLLELQEDFLFNKLTKNQISYYIEESINIGINTSKNFKNINIEKLLNKFNILVNIVEDKNDNINIRAEIYFDNKVKEIKIYKSSLNNMYKSLNNYGFNITEKQVYNIHLAHEFYHFIEYNQNKYTNEKLEKVTYFLLGFIKRKGTILRTREIAAHIFCKELLKLNFHPKLLDYIYLIENKKITIDILKENIKNIENKYLI